MAAAARSAALCGGGAFGGAVRLRLARRAPRVAPGARALASAAGHAGAATPPASASPGGLAAPSATGPTGVLFPGAQADLSGRATAEGTARFAKRFPNMEFRSIPRSGWKVSRFGFGGDDLGKRPAERSKLFSYVTQRRGVNVLEVDVDLLHARFDPAAFTQEQSRFDRDWERRALMRMVERGGVSRDELVCIATVGCGSAAVAARQRRGGDAGAAAVTPGGLPGTSPQDIVDRLARAAEWLGIDGFDIAMAHVPASEREFGAADIADTVQALELVACRERGLAQGWGIACSAFAPLEEGSALDHAGRPLSAQPLSRILNEAGRAASMAGDEPDNHKMLSVRYLASVTNPAAFVPAVVDEAGTEWSVSEILQQLNIAQFVKGPMDSVRDGRVFRAVDADDHEPLDRKELLDSLTESLNFALHLEFMYDREVAAEGRKELEKLREQWAKEREEALVNEMAALPEFAKERGPGESLAARRRRVQEMVATMTEQAKAEEAERLSLALRKAQRGQAGPNASAAAASAAGVQVPPSLGAFGSSGPGTPGGISGSNSVTPYSGNPGERKTIGFGFTAGQVRPGVSALEAPPPPEMPLAEEAAWARVMANNQHRLESLAEFQYFWATRVDPGVYRVVRAMGATEACREWAKAYQASMMNLRHHMTRFLEVRHCVRARMVANMIDGALPEAAPAEDWMAAGGWASDALHDRVVRILAGTPADVLLTEIPELYGVKRPGSFGRIRGKGEPILPPAQDRVPMERIKEVLRGNDVDALLRAAVPDLKVQPAQRKIIQDLLDKGGEEAEFLWSRLSDPARKLFTAPTRDERAAKMLEQEEDERAEAAGRTILDADESERR